MVHRNSIQILTSSYIHKALFILVRERGQSVEEVTQLYLEVLFLNSKLLVFYGECGIKEKEPQL